MNGFQHNWLPKLQLNRLDDPAGRKYVTPEGNAYESVTTFLGRQGKEDIEQWRAAVGEQEANKISRRAANRGTNLHNNVEKFLLNEQVKIDPLDMVGRSLFVPFSKQLKEHVTNIQAIEYPLYSDIFKLAGTMDCLADWDGVTSVLDWKTSKRFKDKYEIKNYFLQTSIYSYMIEERYKLRVPQIVVLIAVEFSDIIQVFVENRTNYREEIIQLLKEDRQHG